MKQATILAALLLTSCGPSIQTAADAAREKAELLTGTKGKVCKQLEAIPDGLDARVDAAKAVCATSASVQAVFAALAGEEACSEAAK